MEVTSSNFHWEKGKRCKGHEIIYESAKLHKETSTASFQRTTTPFSVWQRIVMQHERLRQESERFNDK